MKFEKCRSEFVALIKRENFNIPPYGRFSIRAHWSGPSSGFAEGAVQRRWNDYKDGWEAAVKFMAPEKGEA